MIDSDTSDGIAKLHLWRLISPTLPVGAYAYSQGLEYAIDSGWVSDERSTEQWISGLLKNVLAQLDLPVLARLHRGWMERDSNSITKWNLYLLASRESAELLAEDKQLGGALHTLLIDLNIGDADDWERQRASSYANMFAMGANHWGIPLADTLSGYCWAWCENQVAAAIKLVPLGQTAGQRILSQLIPAIGTAVEFTRALGDDQIGVTAPGLGIASALHETQYSRLFRS